MDEPPKSRFPPGQAAGYQQYDALYFQHHLDERILKVLCL